MARKVDKEVLTGFIEEAKSYLPAIFQGIDTFFADPTRLDKLEEAHRFVHTIKGASSMVGLTGLSHIAYYVEESLEEIGAGNLKLNNETAAFLRRTVNRIDGYLDGILSGALRERPLLADVTRDYRRLRGLPVAEDEAAVAELLAQVEETGAEKNQESAGTEAAAAEPPPEFELISPELLEAFSLEAEDHLRNISALLTNLDRDPEQKDRLQEVRRSVHTLKGAASTVGLPVIANLSHQMEDLLDLLYEGSLEFAPEIMDLLFNSADMLQDLVENKADAETLQTALSELRAQYIAWSDEVAPADRPVPVDLSLLLEPLGEEAIIDLAELAPKLAEADASRRKEEAPPSPPRPGEVVRVSLDRLDELVRLVSELVITRTTFEQRMRGLVRLADELQPSIDRLRRISTSLETEYEVTALGGGKWSFFGAPATGGNGGDSGPAAFASSEFDELELDRYTEFHLLSRALTETTSDIRTVGNELNLLIGDFDGVLNRQGRLSSEIQDKMMRMRMVPLATLSTRLHRAVRVVARKQGKLVDLTLEGEQIELDKAALEEIADPLLHALRNAVDHGIEPPALRQVMGKPERGEIRLRAYYQGNQVVIEISDDGAGLEPQILRAKAVNAGYLSEVDAAKLSDQELYSLIFAPGFSTAEKVSEVSGRGVGLDVLRTNVHKLKGTVMVDSTPGAGVTFTIRLPMTLAVARALLIKSHNETFAIPLAAVTQILRLERDEINLIGREPVIEVGGKVYPLLHLGQVLRLKQAADETAARMPVLILDAGAKQVALAVDEILEGREIVLKTLGNHLRRVHGVTGATLMGDGSVVLILNPAELVSEPARGEQRAWTSTHRPEADGRKPLTIMVVDDSVSVRRVVSNLIKSAGWQPITARDGLEALETIESSARPPDLILLDIEMPRMDGYELAATLQAHELYRAIPIVMITSRAGEKHRQKALSLGVSEYVVKPYQDDVLLNIIRRLAQQRMKDEG